LIVQWARSSRRGPPQVKTFHIHFVIFFSVCYKGGGGNNRNNLTCYNCSRPGHISRNCRESRGGGGDRNGGDRGGGDRGGGDRGGDRYNDRRNNNYDRRGGGGGSRGNYRRRSP